MREFINLFESTKADKKIDGTAFLYMSPKPPHAKFAECGTCVHFRPESKLCALFRDTDQVAPQMSCGLYAHGAPEESQPCRAAVTPEVAGLVDGPVRCRHCAWYDGACGLYATFVEKLPDVFDLDPEVDADGCCNAWQKGK
jgi:hypothetical protein